MNRTSLFALILATAATPALAGNITPVEPEPTPVAPVIVAPTYEWSGPYIGGQINYARAQTDGLLGVDGDGVLVGLRAGYDLDLGRTVVGGLLQYDIGEIELDPSGVEIDNILRVGGRVGYDLGRTLLYGLGGYTTADTNILGDTDGYFIGFGSETFITESVTFGVETIYHDFEDFDDASDVDTEAATVGVNLNFRF
ncbi:outer membrane protein [Jannaschia marina]|uniref:outer membrane protein n=1 Tax=Jannaschia marina TaxID=2741674 RepID=UPI0015CC7140|nr:outer membrane beta-barrel protein [Jannaschia marina]